MRVHPGKASITKFLRLSSVHGLNTSKIGFNVAVKQIFKVCNCDICRSKHMYFGKYFFDENRGATLSNLMVFVNEYGDDFPLYGTN